VGYGGRKHYDILTRILSVYKVLPYNTCLGGREVTHEEEKALHSKDPNAVAHPRDEPDTFVTVGKYAVFFTFLLVELGIFAILINGIRNGIIFALVATEIADTASLIFSLGAFTTFAPIHLGTTYAVGRLMWYLIRDTGD
jgi:hypothetical protein